MSKPGIFDPWRQAPPPPKQPLSRPAPSQDPNEDPPVERCVSFEGKRAGLNVWLDGRTASPVELALARVKQLLLDLHALKHREVSSVLRQHGVSEKEEAYDALPAEAVALALRKILPISPEAAVLLAKYHVKAFIK